MRTNVIYCRLCSKNSRHLQLRDTFSCLWHERNNQNTLLAHVASIAYINVLRIIQINL